MVGSSLSMGEACQAAAAAASKQQQAASKQPVASKQPAGLTSLPMGEIYFLIRTKDIMCVASLGGLGSHDYVVFSILGGDLWNANPLIMELPSLPIQQQPAAPSKQ